MTALNTAKITKEELEKADPQDVLDTYNAATGKNTKSFRTRAELVSRTWKIIEQLAPGEDITSKKHVQPVEKKSKKVATAERKKRGMNFRFAPLWDEAKFKIPREGTIRRKIFDLVDTARGATLEEIMGNLRTKKQNNLYEMLRLIHFVSGVGLWHWTNAEGKIKVRTIRNKTEYAELLEKSKADR